MEPTCEAVLRDMKDFLVRTSVKEVEQSFLVEQWGVMSNLLGQVISRLANEEQVAKIREETFREAIDHFSAAKAMQGTTADGAKEQPRSQEELLAEMMLLLPSDLFATHLGELVAALQTSNSAELDMLGEGYAVGS